MVLAWDKVVENRFTTQLGAFDRRYSKLAGYKGN